MNGWATRAALVIVLPPLALPALALAVNPTKGATYVGERDSTAYRKKISLRVSPNGRSAVATVYCASLGPGKRTPRFAISKGAFHTLVKNGGLTLFTLRGHFVNASTASVRLNVPVTCDGSNKVYTLTRKP